MADWGLQSQDRDNQIISSWGRQSVGAALRIVNPSTGSASTAWGTTNKAIYIPFTIGAPFLAKTMMISVGSTQNGNIDMGIYDKEQNALVTKGSTLQSTASNAQQLDITDTLLQPDLYYMAYAASSATGTLLCTPVANAGVGSALGVLCQLTAFALPTTTATFAANTFTFIPWVAISGRTLL